MLKDMECTPLLEQAKVTTPRLQLVKNTTNVFSSGTKGSLENERKSDIYKCFHFQNLSLL